MSGYDSASGTRDDVNTSNDPAEIRADIERTRAELAGDVSALSDKVNPRTRVRQTFDTAKTKAVSATSRIGTAAPEKARQAREAVRSNPKPTAGVAVLALAGAVAGTVLTRRRAAKAPARSRWAALIRR